MSKFLSVLLGLLVVLPSYAAIERGCGIKSVVFAGFQNKDDNEFLYENSAVYNAVPDKNGIHRDLPARVWECDNEYCSNHTIVQMPAGHYFKGVRQPSANWYNCMEDEWHPFVCGEGYVSFDGNQAAADNEFLYSSKAAFEAAQRASNLGQDGADIPGEVFECDNRHCVGRVTKMMPANHYFKGQLVDHAVEYRCNIGVEDRWEPIVAANNAATCGETYISFDGVQGANDDEFLYSNQTAYNKAHNASLQRLDGADKLGGTVYECDNDHCPNGTIKDMGPGHVFGGEKVNEKRRYMCRANIGGADRWVLMTSLDNGGATPIPVDKTCREKRATDTGKACCDIPANMARYDALKDKCICNGNNDFVIESGRGICKPRENGGGDENVCPDGSSEAYITQESCIGKGTFECTKLANNGVQCLCGKSVPNNGGVQKAHNRDGSIFAQINKWAQECKDENKYSEILALIARIREYCMDERRTEVDFLALVSQLRALNPEQCAKNTLVFVGAATAKIEDAVSTLDVALSDLDVSKWKTEDGKFNTARLASDTIAGVVLGTAGGLITSHVVKKHQVEEGFEDIKCVIGGQSVAGWGDEFNVGVQ